MFFRQVLYRDLGCASYVLGDEGEAIVVDPRWDIDVYLELARTERLRITHVLDTHDHADHVSGRLRLAELTGARSLRAAVPGSGAPDAIEPGDELRVGRLRVRAVGAPGHRPEHLTFAVADLTRGEEDWLLLTGDSLLVGDLARPDLVFAAREGAEMMHASLSALLTLGDHVEIWPGHVGGSLCGGANLSGKTSSTIGYERRHNPMLMMDREQFITALTRDLPPRPPNVERIVGLNQGDLREPAPTAELSGHRLLEELRAGTTIIDARTPAEFDAGHLAGAVNLPAESAGAGTRAGWSLGLDERVVVVAGEPATAGAMIVALQAVGLWNVAGFALGDERAWSARGMPVGQAGAWDVEQLAEALRDDAVTLVDVRDDDEWVAGHVPGSHHLPLYRMADLGQLPNGRRTTAVACMAGARAAFAASLLRRAGRRDVVRIDGGGVPDLDPLGISLTPGA